MPFAFSYGNPFCMVFLYGRAGHLTAENGGFRPGQMARVLGDPQQYRMHTIGRRVLVGWVGNATFAAQSLARDLSLAPDGSLRQKFVPELQMLRMKSNATPGLQAEIMARITVTNGSADGSIGVSVLGRSGSMECTRIGIDMTTQTFFVDATKQGNAFVSAAPILGSSTNATLHIYVDHSYVTAIFNIIRSPSL